MRLVVVVALAGCDLVFPVPSANPPINPDMDGGVDAVDADDSFDAGCAPRFAPPIDIEEFGKGEAELTPALYEGERELFYTVPDFLSFRHSNRANTGEPFGPGVPIAFANHKVRDPSLSSDGLRLVFSTPPPERLAFETTRQTVTSAFDNPVGLPGLETEEVVGIELSGDGRTVYFADTGDTLYSATRPTLGASFGAKTPFNFTGNFPTLAKDELEIFYMRNEMTGEILRRVRGDIDADWGPPEPITDALDPELSADGQTLYVVVPGSNGLSRLTRICAD